METWLKVWAIVASVIATAGQWLARNKEEIESVILRVQKDAKDGLSGAELEQIAVDLFFQKVYIKLPWYAKILGKNFWEKKIRKIAQRFCAKSHALKIEA